MQREGVKMGKISRIMWEGPKVFEVEGTLVLGRSGPCHMLWTLENLDFKL